MNKEHLFSAASLVMDRVMAYGGTQLILSIDESIHNKTGLALGMDVAQKFFMSGRQSVEIKKIMDGGLMFNLKMECVLRQKMQQNKGEK